MCVYCLWSCTEHGFVSKLIGAKRFIYHHISSNGFKFFFIINCIRLIEDTTHDCKKEPLYWKNAIHYQCGMSSMELTAE